MRLAVIGLLVLVTATAGGTLTARGQTLAHELRDGLIFYLPLDGSVEPVRAEGARRVTGEAAEYADGKAGRCVRLGAEGVGVGAPGNFHRPVGTVAFWTRPEWSPADTSLKGNRLPFRTTNFQVCFNVERRILWFMTGKTVPEVGYKWDYSVGSTDVREWEPGEWRHIAITWDAGKGEKALYFDGVLVKSGTTQWLRSDATGTRDRLELGASDAPGWYDEWAIWERRLSAEEVALLVAQPETGARALREASDVGEAPKPWPIEFDMERIEPPVNAVVEPGEEFTARVLARNRGATTFSGDVTFSLVDFWEAVRESKRVHIELGAGAETTIEVAFRARERGIFKVEARLERDGGTWIKDVSSFAAWPEPTAPPDRDSFFGNHVHSWSGGQYLAQAARLGQDWMRNHNMLQVTWWPRVQPEPGPMEWSYDFQMEDVRKYGFPVIGQFFGTPYWAAADGPMPKPARGAYPSGAKPDLAAFRRYVDETVSRYKGYIKHWEIWNEPDVSMFWKGTPEEFAELCRVAYEAAKEADPECIVMPGGFTSPSWPWHEAAAKAGALKYADRISIHYGCPLQAPEETYDELKGVKNHFQRLAREYGPGHELPIWSTEGGTRDTTWLRGMEHAELPPEHVRPAMTWRQGAICTVQAEAIQQLLGIVRHFIYLQNAVSAGPSAYESTQMLDITNAPRPKLMARMAMTEQVRGAECVGEVRRAEGRFWAVLYRKGEGTVALCWVGEGAEVELGVEWPGETRLVDLMGNERALDTSLALTEEPCYVHVEAGAEAVREALERARIVVLRPGRALAAGSTDGQPVE